MATQRLSDIYASAARVKAGKKVPGGLNDLQNKVLEWLISNTSYAVIVIKLSHFDIHCDIPEAEMKVHYESLLSNAGLDPLAQRVLNLLYKKAQLSGYSRLWQYGIRGPNGVKELWEECEFKSATLFKKLGL